MYEVSIIILITWAFSICFLRQMPSISRLLISMFLYWSLLLNMFTYGSWLNWQNIRNILLIFWYRYTWSYCSYFRKFCARRLWHRFEVRTSSAVRIWNPDKTWNLSTSFSIYSSMFFFCIILAAGCPWRMESFMHSSFLHCW